MAGGGDGGLSASARAWPRSVSRGCWAGTVDTKGERAGRASRSGSRIVKINWREVSKFLSGVAFAGSIANFYLWLTGIPVPVPFLGFTMSPNLLGTRAVVDFLLFIVFFYFGWLRK